MTSDLPFRRALLAASPATTAELRRPFADAALAGWQLDEADTWERAHFLLHHDVCDVFLIDETLDPGPEGVAWLAGPRETPVVQLSRPEAERAAGALEGGADVWLPRDLVLAHPPLLAAALNRALRAAELGRRLRLAGTYLRDSRSHVARLVDLLWDSTPRDPRTRWFTQRHMLERLQEELARTARHGTPFSVVLGEVRRTDGEPAGTAAAWAAERVAGVKRRCDVAGQYGPHGFMLLLTHTPEAGAAALCRRLEETLTEDARRQGGAVVASFGIAACADPEATSQGLLRRAEESLASSQGAEETRGE
jgi:diguanylate cyclase (GGDEF)-like protein